MLNKFFKTPLKWQLLVSLLPLILLFMFIKWLLHFYNIEYLSLNPLFTSLIAGIVFIIGFLLSGVLTDYKESEKIPSEISAILDTISDEAYIIWTRKKDYKAIKLIQLTIDIHENIMQTFYEKMSFSEMFGRLEQFNDAFAEIEDICQPAFISRIKVEQNNLRKLILRIQVIRDTSFIQSGYAIVEALLVLVIIALLFLKIEPFYESLFFLSFVAFLITYMLLLIKDLDNPFEYSNKGESSGEITLFPLQEVLGRLTNKLNKCRD